MQEKLGRILPDELFFLAENVGLSKIEAFCSKMPGYVCLGKPTGSGQGLEPGP